MMTITIDHQAGCLVLLLGNSCVTSQLRHSYSGLTQDDAGTCFYYAANFRMVPEYTPEIFSVHRRITK